MRLREPRWVAALLLVLLWGCAQPHVSDAGTASRRPPVILISIDGMRPDYLDRGVTPNLNRLIATGAFADMRPAFPSLTFPNHYTLVTGLRPDHHGMIGNTMRDGRRPGDIFRLSERAMVNDAFWWNDGEPVWVTAEQAGVPTATLFWPGSEAPIHGTRPGRWLVFDSAMPATIRVAKLLSWFDEGTRPGFATLYFDDVDHAGHEKGPDSHAVTDALRKVDAAVGRLVGGLAERGITANLVVVSDHGMATVGKGQAIALDSIVPAQDIDVVSTGAYAGIIPRPKRVGAVEARLLGQPHPHMRCWRRGEIPAHLGYGTHPRVPPIFCLADPGWMIQADASPAKRAPPKGMHGYDHEGADMRAIFIGNGPAFRAGTRLPTFDNVDVYPLLMALIGVPARPSDGTLTPLRPALK